MHIDREIYIHINRIYRVFTAVSFDDTNLRLLNPNTVQQPTPGKHILFYSAKNFFICRASNKSVEYPSRLTLGKLGRSSSLTLRV